MKSISLILFIFKSLTLYYIMSCSPFGNVFKYFAGLHDLSVVLYAFRDCDRLYRVYKLLPYARASVYNKVESLVKQGLLIKRRDGDDVYYRVIAPRIFIPNFGAIELDDFDPVIHLFIDGQVSFSRYLRRNGGRVEAVVIGGKGGKVFGGKPDYD